MRIVNDTALISIIVPAYNCADRLPQCLKSLQEQSYTNIEIIVVNDGSKDTTRNVIESFADRDKRINAINKPNGGVSSARNEGLRRAQGEFIMFVDSDDSVGETFCEEMLTSLLQTNSDMAVCGYQVVKNGILDGNILPTMPNEQEILPANIMFSKLYAISRSCFSVSWNKLFKRSKIEKYFDIGCSWGEDLKFNIAYLKQSSNVVLIGRALYYYSIEEKGESLNKDPEQVIINLKQNIDAIIAYCDAKDEFAKSFTDRYYTEYFYYCEVFCGTNLQKVITFSKAIMGRGNYNTVVKMIHPHMLKSKLIRLILKSRQYYLIAVLITIHQWSKGR